jgi:hypothetical protein
MTKIDLSNDCFGTATIVDVRFRLVHKNIVQFSAEYSLLGIEISHMTSEMKIEVKFCVHITVLLPLKSKPKQCYVVSYIVQRDA